MQLIAVVEAAILINLAISNSYMLEGSNWIRRNVLNGEAPSGLMVFENVSNNEQGEMVLKSPAIYFLKL